MSRKLIDRDRLKKEIHENDIMGGLNYAWYIDHAELVDAVEVVRCKDCKYNKGTKVWLDGDVTIDCDNGMGYPPPDWFCADGEEKSDE